MKGVITFICVNLECMFQLEVLRANRAMPEKLVKHQRLQQFHQEYSSVSCQNYHFSLPTPTISHPIFREDLVKRNHSGMGRGLHGVLR